MTKFSLTELEMIIKNRVSSTAETSYTKSLLENGISRIAKKFGEEATEAVIAAVSSDDASVIGEAADVLYHLLVLLRAREISLTSVISELERRTSLSGHAEKSSRTK